MAGTYHLQVVAQDRIVFDGDVISMIAPGEAGYLGVLKDHAPLLSTLGEGVLTIQTPSETKTLTLRGGFLEMLDNEATILADSIGGDAPSEPA